jgi:hypothetical protein
MMVAKACVVWLSVLASASGAAVGGGDKTASSLGRTLRKDELLFLEVTRSPTNKSTNMPQQEAKLTQSMISMDEILVALEEEGNPVTLSPSQSLVTSKPTNAPVTAKPTSSSPIQSPEEGGRNDELLFLSVTKMPTGKPTNAPTNKPTNPPTPRPSAKPTMVRIDTGIHRCSLLLFLTT